MAAFISNAARKEFHNTGFLNTLSCVPYDNRSLTGMDGMRKIVASSTNALTTVKNTIAAENENSLAM